MAFDSFAFDETLDEIETLLGYLMGNERAYLYLMSVRHDLGQQYQDGQFDDYSVVEFVFQPDYKFPCPDGSYAVTPIYTPGQGDRLVFLHPVPTDEGSGTTGPRPETERFENELKTNTNAAWQQGVSWAHGIADYCRSVCDQFTQISPEEVADAIADIQKGVLAKLKPDTDVDDSGWAKIGHIESFWTGKGSLAFDGFYRGFTAAVGRAYSFTCDVVAAFGVFAGYVHGTQIGAQKYVESVRDNLRKQLTAWVDAQCRPEDPPTSPPWLADFEKIASSAWAVVGDIPVVGEVKDQVDKFVGTVTDVKDLVVTIADVSGAKIGEPKPEIKVQGAEQIYTDLTDTLYNTYYQGFRNAMDQLLNGNPHASSPTDPGQALPFSVKQALSELKTLDDPNDQQFFPETVESTKSPYHKGDAYPR